MTRAFLKDVFASVRSSAGRFVAIALIAALGAGFYAGLRMTGSDMRLAADEFYDGTNMSDLRVVCTLGLSDSNIQQIRDTQGVRAVMPAYESDALANIGEGQYTVRIHSLNADAARASDCTSGEAAYSDDENYLNRPILIEGRWPENAGECIVSADAVLEDHIAIGDVITLAEGTNELADTFTQTSFTVVGTAKLSYYACLSSMGSSSLGAGEVEQVLYVPEAAFADDLPYTEAFITVDGARELDGSSADYDAAVDAVKERLEVLADEIAQMRLDEVKGDAQAELDENRATFEEEERDAWAQLNDAQAELDDAAQTLADSAATIAESEQQLSDGVRSYEDGVAQLAAQREQATSQLDSAQAELDSAQAGYDAAIAQRAELQTQLETAEAGLAQVEQAIATLDTLDTQLASVEAAIAALDPADPDYDTQLATLEAQKAQIEAGIAQLPDRATLEAQKAQAQSGISQLEDGIAQIDAQTTGVPEQISSGRAQLAAQREQAQQMFSQAEATLAASAAQLESGRAQLESGKQQYAQGVEEYESGLAEFTEQRAEAIRQLEEARTELDDAQAEIDDIDIPECYVLDRSKLVGAESFENDSQRIDRIAAVFPFLFFLVAALVSLTTMTRMVDEERILIGTYKALGYSKAVITSKYLIYALAASGFGSLVGILVLTQFLPWFIMNAYAIIYIAPARPTPIDPGLGILSFVMSVGITVGATWLAATSTLRERPASLMLPRAPKAGKRILLERIYPVWSRLSFSWKVTARNIFRYKQRFFMAIIGIAGCTALLLTGWGLQDAINDIIDKQFGDIYHYDLTVHLDDDEVSSTDDEARQDASETDAAAGDASSSDAASDDTAGDTSSDDPASGDTASDGTATKVLDSSAATAGFASVFEKSVIARVDGSEEDTHFEIIVPEDEGEFTQFIELRDRSTSDAVALADDGAIVCEKLANKLGLGVGDSFIVYAQDDIGNASGEGTRVRISGITENYVGLFAYFSTDAYASVFGEDAHFDTILVSVDGGSQGQDELIDRLSACSDVKTVSHNEEVISTYRNMLSSVDAVVVVLIVAAALLAFVVLYNLTNINITERVREIATLKVLGFLPKEVYAYIFRETLILSLIGSLIGLVLGVGMEAFVVTTAEVDQVMFGREIHPSSFVLSFVLTMVFTVIVMLFMRRKLAKVDMVESLKSNE